MHHCERWGAAKVAISSIANSIQVDGMQIRPCMSSSCSILQNFFLHIGKLIPRMEQLEVGSMRHFVQNSRRPGALVLCRFCVENSGAHGATEMEGHSVCVCVCCVANLRKGTVWSSQRKMGRRFDASQKRRSFNKGNR